jgi:FtsZ-interacting cell division protein ZipA
MSELQIALLLIAVVVIVAVYGFGWWQQRQYHRKYGATFSAERDDALYQKNAWQPSATVSDTSVVSEPSTTTVDFDLTEAWDEVIEDEVTSSSTTPTLLDESRTLLDERSDFMIELVLAEPSPASVLDGFWQRKFDFSKPVQVCGLREGSEQWERAIAESSTLYVRLKVALQLVDRGGVVSAARLADFSDLVLGIAKQINAKTKAPDFEVIHAKAVELDKLCASVDRVVGVNLVPPSERLLAGSEIARTAAVLGMTLESDGAYHLLSEQGRSLFMLTNQDARPLQHETQKDFNTRGVTLLLDVPRVEEPTTQFDQMVRAAHEFAKELQLNVVDDNGVLLETDGLALIREQLAEIEKKMLNNGIVPGSAQARRLFS